MRRAFGSDVKGMLREINRPVPKKGIVEVGVPGLSTSLHMAMSLSSPRVVSLLLEYGARPDLPEVSDRTPLGVACERGDLATVELLLTHGASATRSDGQGLSPMERCCASGQDANCERIQQLLRDAS